MPTFFSDITHQLFARRGLIAGTAAAAGAVGFAGLPTKLLIPAAEAAGPLPTATWRVSVAPGNSNTDGPHNDGNFQGKAVSPYVLPVVRRPHLEHRVLPQGAGGNGDPLLRWRAVPLLRHQRWRQQRSEPVQSRVFRGQPGVNRVPAELHAWPAPRPRADRSTCSAGGTFVLSPSRTGERPCAGVACVARRPSPSR